MARVGYVPTVSAYEGNVGQQLMKVGEKLEGVSQDFERKEQEELAQAKKLYTQGLNIGLYNSINELRNDPKLSANPKGLGDAMDKVLEKTLADVTDDDVKMEVMVDYQLKKGTYVNQAQNEFNRVQRAKAKSYAYDSVYANIDSMGMSFANALTGNYTEDDIANYQHSLDKINANINAKNPDGTYIFTDSQRRAMAKDAKSSYLNGFKAVFEQLDEKQQQEVEQAINNNSYVIAQVDNKDKPEEKLDITLKDAVGEDSYKDIQNYVKKYNRAALAEREKERKYQGLLAKEEFLDDPTEESLQKAFEMNPLMSDTEKKKLTNHLEKSPNYEATTTFEGNEAANQAILDLSVADFDTEDKAFDALVDMTSKLQRTQIAGKLSVDDYYSRLGQLKTVYANEAIRKNIAQVRPTAMDYFNPFKLPAYSGASTRKTLKDIENKAMTDAMNLLISGGTVEDAKKIYHKAREDGIRFVNPEIGNAKVGDTIIVQGRAVKIISFEGEKPVVSLVK